MNDTALKTNEVVKAGVERRMSYTPQVDILEYADRLVLHVDLPGVKGEDVDVNFERGELTVKARRKPVSEGGRCLVAEFEPGDYYRAFLISQDIAGDQISAELKNGVLKVDLPRASGSLPRRIAVKA